MTSEKKFSIAMDGPAGSGKSTIAKLLALRFGLSYVDTGAMYRAVALLAREAGVDPADEQALASISDSAVFEFEMDRSSATLLNRLRLNGRDRTDDIRDPEISNLASKVSALSGVRRLLVARQKNMGREGGVVMEGRDICNVVLPDAEVKIFLDASARERAGRRHLELQQKGLPSDFDKVLEEMLERDHRDSTRTDSPLRPAHDASIVNTDHLSIEQVVDAISAIVTSKTGVKPAL
jgi:CMP/dCMP kinase